jgi:osmotically-inducible protein OsmY
MEDEPKHYVVQRVRQALAHDGRTNELDIQVKLAGGKVFITGSIPTAERCRAIEEVASEAAPGFEIQNHVVVYEAREPDEEEHLA